MIEYRVSVSKKPTVRLWRVEGKKRKLLAELEGLKAVLLEQYLFQDLPLRTFLNYRDGRRIYSTEEESALKLLVAMKGVTDLRDTSKVKKILEAVNGFEQGETFWWYSLYLKHGYKGIQALRAVYI